MNRDEAVRLLAAAAARDNRTPSGAMADAWAVDLADVPYDLAVAAVNRHFRESTEYLMPAHVLAGAREIAREMRRQAREEAERAEETAERERRLAIGAGPLSGRSPEVRALVAETVERWASDDSALERARIRARQMRGRPEFRSKHRDRQPPTNPGFGPPTTPEAAALARQYLADGHSPDKLAAQLGISKKWLRRAASDPGSLPPPTGTRQTTTYRERHAA